MLRSTWRGLETWHGRDAVTPRNRKGEATGNTNFDLNRRASPRPYLRGRRGEIPLRYSTDDPMSRAGRSGHEHDAGDNGSAEVDGERGEDPSLPRSGILI